MKDQGKVFQVAGKVLSITFKSGKAFKNSRKGFFPKIPWERKGKGIDSVLPRKWPRKTLFQHTVLHYHHHIDTDIEVSTYTMTH